MCFQFTSSVLGVDPLGVALMSFKSILRKNTPDYLEISRETDVVRNTYFLETVIWSCNS